MIKRYLEKRNNPWELLLLAFVILVPGVALLLQRHTVMLLNAGSNAVVIRATLLSPFAGHLCGALAVVFSVLLAGLYFYARRSIARDEQAPPPHFLGS